MLDIKSWISFENVSGLRLALGAVFTLSAAWLTPRLFQLQVVLKGINFLPGHRHVISPYTMLGRLIPFEIPYLNRKPNIYARAKRAGYNTFNSDIYSTTILYPVVQAVLFVGDAGAAKEITSNRALFPKPVQAYRSIAVFGPNIVTTEFDDWKRHRRIAAPSFSERNNRLVFDATSEIVNELFEYWSKQFGTGPVKLDDAVDMTAKLALMVISAAAFGKRPGWDEDDTPPEGHKMTFHRSLQTVMHNILVRLLFPDRMLDLWEGGRTAKLGFKEFGRYMVEMIEEGRNNAEQGEDQRADLFSSLLKGAAVEDGKGGMSGISDEELMGNVFIFLFAGHETTAHTLGFALVMLSVHQDHQQKLFEELRKMVPSGGSPTYADIVRWSSGLALIYEVLRLYPSVPGFPKTVAEDTVLHTTSTDGKNTPITIPIPKDTRFVIDVIGIHYNPKYWDNPHEFRPERFLGDYNRDAFIPFAAGPRACLGRRFSEIEALTVLANLILRYRIEPTALSPDESLEERNARVLKWHEGSVTLRPTKAALTFIPRE
ncbi:cytochrome P450 [Serendipita vermifera]|nr:cytochrome P450 [Serendipita vermifera]